MRRMAKWSPMPWTNTTHRDQTISRLDDIGAHLH